MNRMHESLASLMNPDDGSAIDFSSCLSSLRHPSDPSHEVLGKFADCLEQDDAAQPMQIITSSINEYLSLCHLQFNLRAAAFLLAFLLSSSRLSFFFLPFHLTNGKLVPD